MVPLRFFQLPEDVTKMILQDWLCYARELAGFDVACCEREARPIYLRCIRGTVLQEHWP